MADLQDTIDNISPIVDQVIAYLGEADFTELPQDVQDQITTYADTLGTDLENLSADDAESVTAIISTLDEVSTLLADNGVDTSYDTGDVDENNEPITVDISEQIALADEEAANIDTGTTPTNPDDNNPVNPDDNNPVTTSENGGDIETITIDTTSGTEVVLGDDPDTEEIEEPFTYYSYGVDADEDGNTVQTNPGDTEYVYDGKESAFIEDTDGKVVIKLDGDFKGFTYDDSDEEYPGIYNEDGTTMLYWTGIDADGNPVDFEVVDADGNAISLDNLQGYFEGTFQPGPTLEEQIATLKAEVESLTGEKEDLAGQVETLTGEKEDLAGQVETLTGEKQDLAGQVETLTGEKQDLADQVETLTGEKTTAETATTAAKADTQKLLDAIDALTPTENDVEDLAAALTALTAGLGGKNTDPTAEITLEKDITIGSGKTLSLGDIFATTKIADAEKDALDVKIDLTGGEFVIDGATGTTITKTVSGVSNYDALIKDIEALNVKADKLADGTTEGSLGIKLTVTDAHEGTKEISETLKVTPAPTITDTPLDGSGATLVKFDASKGAFNFIDDVTKESNVEITGFGADDVLTIKGATKAKYDDGVISNSGTDVSLVYNNTAVSQVNTIKLVGVAQASDLIFNVASLEGKLGTDATTNIIFG